MDEETSEQPSPYEPGRPLVLIRYGNFYDRAANGYAGRMMLVGSDLTCVRPVGAYVRVRNGFGEEGDLLLASVSLEDPRQWFSVEAPPLAGYLIDGLYDDGSGGSLDTITLEDVPALGTIVLDARAVRALRAEVGRITVAMHDGTELQGRSPKLWLVTSTLRVNLAKAAMLLLTRRPPVAPAR